MNKQSAVQYLLVLIYVLLMVNTYGQNAVSSNVNGDKLTKDSIKPDEQKDVIDIFNSVFHKPGIAKLQDTSKPKPGRLYYSILPGAGYNLSTGITANTTTNFSFYTHKGDEANISTVFMSIDYTALHQITLPIVSNIWARKNKYDITGDWRYYKYPTFTYGLGGYSKLSDADLIDYSFIRVYQNAMRSIGPDLLAGLGYNLDYHWNIAEVNNPILVNTDYQKYTGNSHATSSTSSGLSFNLLYDSRRNSNNPQGGYYTNVFYKNSMRFMGSDNDWQSLIIDFRKYVHLNSHTKNILALWSMNWFTLAGKPPYFDLPSTGWDTYSNSGRGYIQGRLRGNNLVYFESEYRISLTKNGLFGCVIFANAESVSDYPNNKFSTIYPGVGAGLRIKVNKSSNTNFSFDYAFGKDGTRGVFLNLGEVF